MIKRYNTLLYEEYGTWEYVHPGVYKKSPRKNENMHAFIQIKRWL
jgi:hypothetical protein